MSTPPVIRKPATRATTPRKLFVNLPVTDLQRAITFFEDLGFEFNTQFTDATAASMLVGEDAYFMLLTPAKFAEFTSRPVPDPRERTAAIFAVGVDTREAVDTMVNAALSSGGSRAKDAFDHGFMYGWSFYDPEGNHWEVFWMNPEFVQH